MTTAGIPFRKTQSGSALAATLPPADVLSTALCAQVDPEQWYPTKGATSQEAKDICNRCPVRQQCLDYAMATEVYDHHRHGVWGGLAPRERAALARQLDDGEAAA